jgi:hypothetical protein
MRLHHARDKALDWRKGRKINSNERIVTWKRPQHPRGSTLTREEWDNMPESMELRLIRFHFENRAGKKAELIVVTTLLDSKQHAGEELADLYARRWEIELKLRDLKTTLGMERFDVKSPDMAHKTLLMSVIAYNLIRSVMQKAAHEAGEPIWHMSFKGVLDLIVSSHESLRTCAGKPRKRHAAVSQIVSICATKLIDIRPFRREPRTVKRRPKAYQLLTEHRSTFIEIHHRGRYRKSA